MKSRIRKSLSEVPPFRKLQSARLGAVLVFAVVACSDTTAPKPFVSIAPVSESVILQTENGNRVLRTSVTLTNTSNAAVTWNYCGLTLEKNIAPYSLAAADGPSYPWATVATPPCAIATLVAPAPLQPGASVAIPVEVYVGQTGSVSFDGSPGEYRVHLLLATQTLFGKYQILPHDLSVSDPFSLITQ